MFWDSLVASVRNISHRAVFRFILLITVIQIPLFEYDVAAQQSGCGTTSFQDWYWRSSTEPFKKIRGTLAKRPHLNEGDNFFSELYADSDWNFYVVPDDSTVLTNSRGYSNANGQIEFELCTYGWPTGVPDAFPEGSRIEAYGEWVEDYGHDPMQGDTPVPVPPDSDTYGGKTELHPLYWIKTLDKNPMKIFMGQDMSGRFVDAQNVLWEYADYPITPQYPIVTPSQMPPSNTQVFHETASIAGGVASNWVSPSGYGVFVKLEPGYFSACEDRARVIVPEGSPHYFGSIFRSSASLLKETLRYSVSYLIDDPSHTHPFNDRSHQKIANLHVEVELKDPPGSLLNIPDNEAHIVWSRWEYESSAGITGPVTESKAAPPHKIVFNMPYSPALGLNTNKWRMSVRGGSADNGTRVPLNHTSNLSRTLVTEGRTYSIQPSRITLMETAKGSGACPDVIYLTIDKSKLLPEIDLRLLTWRVKVLKDANGQDIASQSEIVITPESPIENLGFSIQTYPHPNEERLDVRWKKLSSGYPNLSKVLVTAGGVTELGEQVSATVGLDAICGLGSYTFAEVLDYSYRYMKSRKIRGELYKKSTIGGLTAEDREWLIAFGKFRKKMPLTEQEQKLLLSVAKKGAELPEIKHPSLQPIHMHQKIKAQKD